MTVIPQGIMAAARSVVNEFRPEWILSADLTKSIARAILAERRRCVDLANAERVLPLYENSADADPTDVSYDMAIDHVITAIKGA